MVRLTPRLCVLGPIPWYRKFMTTNMGVIYLAATPIGNTGDASPRLQELLAEADIIAAEDTRRVKALCSRLGITPRGQVLAVHDHNEREKAGRLVQSAVEGNTVLLVSDAGTPTVSDPGFRVTKEAIAAGATVRPLPGPSAALAALSVSGLPSDRFTFEGFLPRKTSERQHYLQGLAHEPRTMIFFESARRLKETLEDMAQTLGNERQAVICRELTKTHEEILRGTFANLLETLPDPVLGEITLVVAGFDAEQLSEGHLERAAKEALELAAQGLRLKDAAAVVAQRTGLKKNQVYRQAVSEDK